MFLFAIAALIYGIASGIPHETLFLGIAVMIAGLAAGERST